MAETKLEVGIKMKSDQSLESFVSQVLRFDELTASIKIDYFTYYLTVIQGEDGADGAMIKTCFLQLRISPYSNIPSYLKNNCRKGRSITPKFVLQNKLYHLERSYKQELEKNISTVPINPATSDYFPLSLFDNTRGYLIKIANQACSCFDFGLYDACAVMTRKLLEVLIIEVFERHGLSQKIKSPAGHFFYLSDLIDLLLSETTWNVGRNARSAIPSLKKMGDQSAHNRRYFVQESEIRKNKDDLRLVLEELLHLVDYPHWK